MYFPNNRFGSVFFSYCFIYRYPKLPAAPHAIISNKNNTFSPLLFRFSFLIVIHCPLLDIAVVSSLKVPLTTAYFFVNIRCLNLTIQLIFYCVIRLLCLICNLVRKVLYAVSNLSTCIIHIFS